MEDEFYNSENAGHFDWLRVQPGSLTNSSYTQFNRNFP